MQFEGRTIVEVRRMTDAEAAKEGWSDHPIVLVFDNGLKLYPARDEEGNGGGALFGTFNDNAFQV